MRSRKKWLTLSAAIFGLLLPFYWLAVAFKNFNAPQTPAADRFWEVINLTCPSFDLMGSPLGFILAPLINSAMYGFVMWCLVSFVQFLRSRIHRSVGS